MSLILDRPIQHAEQDLLDRQSLAQSVAAFIAGPLGSGGIVGVSGPWGAGKTSFINLVIAELGRLKRGGNIPYTIHLEAWALSQPGELAANLYASMAVKVSNEPPWRTISKLLGEIGRAIQVIGIAGSPASQAAAALQGAGGVLQVTAQKDLAVARDRLSKALSHAYRLRVVIDDLDRMPRAAMINLLQTLRVAGDLPNTVFLLGIDRTRAARGIENEFPGEGRSFMDKYFDWVVELPAPTPVQIERMVLASLSRQVGRELEPKEESDLRHFLSEPVLEALATPRQVRRVLVTFHALHQARPGPILLADLLAVAIIATISPELYLAMRRRVARGQALGKGIPDELVLPDNATRGVAAELVGWLSRARGQDFIFPSLAGREARVGISEHPYALFAARYFGAAPPACAPTDAEIVQAAEALHLVSDARTAAAWREKWGGYGVLPLLFLVQGLTPLFTTGRDTPPRGFTRLWKTLIGAARVWKRIVRLGEQGAVASDADLERMLIDRLRAICLAEAFLPYTMLRPFVAQGVPYRMRANAPPVGRHVRARGAADERPPTLAEVGVSARRRRALRLPETPARSDRELVRRATRLGRRHQTFASYYADEPFLTKPARALLMEEFQTHRWIRRFLVHCEGAAQACDRHGERYWPRGVELSPVFEYVQGDDEGGMMFLVSALPARCPACAKGAG